MNRVVEPELLDVLPPQEPLAAGSRRDLRRLNAWMGNARIMACALEAPAREPPRRLAELGAGDGDFLCRVARRLPGRWKGTRAVLIDRVAAFAPGTQSKFVGVGWNVEMVTSDVLEWLDQPREEEQQALVANLFLHHFSQAQLAALLDRVARRAETFVAVEPRRSQLALAFSHLVGLIGCNRVTRHDAPVSVRAGFNSQELSQLWAGNGEWSLVEKRVGLFSHVFVARRTGALCRP